MKDQKQRQQFAQGDILLVAVDPNSTGMKYTMPVERAVVGYGEASGHSHVITAKEAGKKVEWLVQATEDIEEEKQRLHRFALGQEVDAPVFIHLADDSVISHVGPDGSVITYDHTPIELPAGTYKVIRQRIATADSVRPALD